MFLNVNIYKNKKKENISIGGKFYNPKKEIEKNK